MAFAHWRPTFSSDYATAARAYAIDLASSFFLFVCASIMAGRVWRFPFDDEIFTLAQIERLPAIDVLTFFLTGHDVHPPLATLLVSGLYHLGLSEPAMRLCSLAMTAIALALFHLLALTLIAQRSGQAVSLPSRLIAVLLFGLSALAISQGDALRWYPLFTMLIAVFAALYLGGGNDAARLWSAVPLGLAASTNFIAALVIIPFAIFRYGLQRQFRAPFEAAYWLLFAVFASFGLCSAYSLFVHHYGSVATQLGDSVLRAALTDALGFFGGHALGVGQSWIVVPSIIIAVAAAVSAIDRRQPANPAHLLLMMLAATALMALGAFAKPRSFLYLAPVMAVVLTLFLDRQTRQRNGGFAVLMTGLLVATSVGAIVNIKDGTRPFKRNSVIPYQNIVDFIQSNGAGSELVVSTDPVMPWVLKHQYGRGDRCVSFLLTEGTCIAAARRYETIFLITGYSDRSANAAFMRFFNSVLAEVIAERRKVATIHVGIDRDAALKSRLTGVPLSEEILTVDLYR